MTGLTWGRVETVLTSNKVHGWEELYWFDGLFCVSGQGGEPFTQHGDGGALVVTEDGTALGLIIAGNEHITFACLLASILDEFGCELLTSKK